MIKTHVLKHVNTEYGIIKDIDTNTYLVEFEDTTVFKNIGDLIYHLNRNSEKVLLDNILFKTKNTSDNYIWLRLGITSDSNKSSIPMQLDCRRKILNTNSIEISKLSEAEIFVYKNRFYLDLKRKDDFLCFDLMSSDKLVLQYSKLKRNSILISSWHSEKDTDTILDLHNPKIDYGKYINIDSLLIDIDSSSKKIPVHLRATLKRKHFKREKVTLVLIEKE